jgi:four helix bundle protein
LEMRQLTAALSLSQEVFTTAERPAARTLRDLLVWRKAHQFAVYSFTATFPKSETYGLSPRMRKAAVSVPANIAEGFRRRGKADKGRFLNQSESSLEKSRYYLILSEDLGYGKTAEPMGSLEEVSRLLNSYSKAILDSSSGSLLLTPGFSNPRARENV